MLRCTLLSALAAVPGDDAGTHASVLADGGSCLTRMRLTREAPAAPKARGFNDEPAGISAGRGGLALTDVRFQTAGPIATAGRRAVATRLRAAAGTVQCERDCFQCCPERLAPGQQPDSPVSPRGSGLRQTKITDTELAVLATYVSRICRAN